MEDAKGILHLFHFLAASAAFSIYFTATSNWVSIPFKECSGLL